MSLLFNHICPTCGRKLKIRVELLGRTVACQHCRAEFIASDRPVTGPTGAPDRLMTRVDRVLQLTKSTVSTDVKLG